MIRIKFCIRNISFGWIYCPISVCSFGHSLGRWKVHGGVCPQPSGYPLGTHSALAPSCVAHDNGNLRITSNGNSRTLTWQEPREVSNILQATQLQHESQETPVPEPRGRPGLGLGAGTSRSEPRVERRRRPRVRAALTDPALGRSLGHPFC